MQNPWIRPNRPLIVAHRGYSTRAPENTMAAYQLAVESGTEMIEADVNITRDGVPVMIHDWHLRRTANVQAAVHDLSLSELRKLDVGSWFGENFAGTKIPTTEELLQFAKDSGILMCFEIKGDNPKRSIQIAESVLDLFERYDAFEWSFMSSYWHEALAVVKNKAPQLLLAPERLPDNVEPDIPEAIRQAKDLNAEVLQIHYDYLYEDVLSSLRRESIALWAWPTTSEEAIVKAIKAGADGIMGDDPGLEVKLVNQYCSSEGVSS